MSTGSRAEIQNVQNLENPAILNFSSAIRGHLENVNILLTSLITWSKKYHIDFERWPSSRVIEGNVQGGSDFCMILQHRCLVTLIASMAKGSVPKGNRCVLQLNVIGSTHITLNINKVVRNGIFDILLNFQSQWEVLSKTYL